MKRLIAAILAGGAALLVASMLGVAAAEAPTTAPLRTVTVEGVASVPVAQGAKAAAATAVYRQAMANAVLDGQSKAEFLAGKVGATLGSVQSVVEGGGSISCTGGEESGYVEYEGEQPDFGSGSSVSPITAAKGVAAPRAPTHKPKKKKKTKRTTPTAKKAATGTCTLTTQVSLVDTIN
jgi:hypothetical protein